MLRSTKISLLGFCATLIIGGSVAFAANEDSGTSQVAAMRDPTKPAGYGDYAASDNQGDNIYGIKIDGIIFSKERKIVTINGQYLQVGDKIGQLVITDIYQDAIKVKDSNISDSKKSELLIKMPHSDIKSLSTANPKKSKGRF